jgi:hypothetical protein
MGNLGPCASLLVPYLTNGRCLSKSPRVYKKGLGENSATTHPSAVTFAEQAQTCAVTKKQSSVQVV